MCLLEKQRKSLMLVNEDASLVLEPGHKTPYGPNIIYCGNPNK